MKEKIEKPVHYHQYERFFWPSGKPYYKCMTVGCPHFLSVAGAAIGRESLCWGDQCNKLVTITKEDVLRQVKRPMCESCKKVRAERRRELSRVT